MPSDMEGKGVGGGTVDLMGARCGKEAHLGQYTPISSDVQDDHTPQHTARLARWLSCSGPMDGRTGLFVVPHLEKPFADHDEHVRCGFISCRANLPRSFYQSASSHEKWATSGSLTAEIGGGDGGSWSPRGRGELDDGWPWTCHDGGR
jgi:hypothetical protein